MRARPKFCTRATISNSPDFAFRCDPEIDGPPPRREAVIVGNEAEIFDTAICARDDSVNACLARLRFCDHAALNAHCLILYAGCLLPPVAGSAALAFPNAFGFA